MAEENRSWGYDRIVGALANLGFEVSDQTVGNVLRRHGLPLLAGTDFFTAEVLTLRGLATYYVLFFIHLESRRVDIAGITVQPDEPWMKQITRNVTMQQGEPGRCSWVLRPTTGRLQTRLFAISEPCRARLLTENWVLPYGQLGHDHRVVANCAGAIPGWSALQRFRTLAARSTAVRLTEALI